MARSALAESLRGVDVGARDGVGIAEAAVGVDGKIVATRSNGSAGGWTGTDLVGGAGVGVSPADEFVHATENSIAIASITPRFRPFLIVPEPYPTFGTVASIRRSQRSTGKLLLNY